MRAIKNKNTRIEEILAKALWRKGYRYRRNNKTVFGMPDITFKKYKIAVFCDSEYFHGKDWARQKGRIRTNTEFWQRKIEGNINRDKVVNDSLLKDGWKVLRFWGQDIKKDLNLCLAEIEQAIKEREESRK